MPEKLNRGGPDRRGIAGRRNRGKWEDCLAAAEDMLIKTGTYPAPWVIVGSEDKLHARIRILKTIVESLAQEL